MQKTLTKRGGIQLGRPQKNGLFGPPPVRIFVLKGQTPSHLVRPQGLTPPPKKEKSLQNAWLQL